MPTPISRKRFLSDMTFPFYAKMSSTAIKAEEILQVWVGLAVIGATPGLMIQEVLISRGGDRTIPSTSFATVL